MPVTRALYTSIRDIVADVARVPADRLTPLTRFSTLGLTVAQRDQIYLRACQQQDVSLAQIIATRPTPTPLVDPRSLASLQIIAPFDDRARDLLARLDAYPDDDTISSVAESIEEEAYIPSGFRLDGSNPPHSRTGVLVSAGICVALCIFALPAAMAAILEDPATFWMVLPAGSGLCVAFGIWALLPGMGAIWRHGRRSRWRLPL